MTEKKDIFVIVGSASKNSANLKIIDYLGRLTNTRFHLSVFEDLKTLPPFDPELSISDPPAHILFFRNSIAKADGIIICTPEYIFSIPSGLKNAIEWCVSTTVFSGKPVGLITASASGEKAHEALQLIMKTVMAKFTEETTLLIPGIKGKINERGEIRDEQTKQALERFFGAFQTLVAKEQVPSL